MSPEIIRSRTNAVIKRLRALKARAGDLVLVEGLKLTEEALRAGIELVEVVASPRLMRTERGRRVRETVERRGAPLRLVDEDLLASLSEVEASQGVLAVARRPSFDEERLFRGVPLVVVAAGIQDPGNVGALLRSAEAAGATGAYLTAGTADPLSCKALRGSMGSALRLPHRRELSAAEVLQRTRRRGLRLVGATLRGGMPYERADLSRPLALFFGSEGSGLPPQVETALDESVTIPMSHPVESLNVAVAAGVLLFEAARQRRA